MPFGPGEILDSMWTIVDESNKDPAALVTALQALNEGAMIRFIWSYQNAIGDVSSARFGAHLGVESEDGLEDLGDWIVSQGQAYFDSVTVDPTQIPAGWGDLPPTATHSFHGTAVGVYIDRFDSVPPGQRT